MEKVSWSYFATLGNVKPSVLKRGVPGGSSHAWFANSELPSLAMEVWKVKLWCHLLEKCRFNFSSLADSVPNTQSLSSTLGDPRPAEEPPPSQVRKHCLINHQYAFSFPKPVLWGSGNWKVISLAVFSQRTLGQVEQGQRRDGVSWGSPPCRPIMVRALFPEPLGRTLPAGSEERSPRWQGASAHPNTDEFASAPFCVNRV